MPTARVDLHCHSTASDGRVAPAEVVAQARAAELRAIALTDHDTIDGVAAAVRAGRELGVRVVAGCEFSVRAPWGELHVLGYFLTPANGAVDAFLQRTRAARRQRGERMVARLHEIGVPLDPAAVERQAGGGALGRPHVARALVAEGFCANLSEAFGRWLARGRPAFVEKPLPALQEVTELVHGVDGIAVAAHLGDHGSEGQIRLFRDAGLDGIEVRHPSHSPATEQRLTALARRLDLAITGGSDWHGETELGNSHAPLGGMDVPLEWLERLDERRARRARQAG